MKTRLDWSRVGGREYPLHAGGQIAVVADGEAVDQAGRRPSRLPA